MTAMEEDIDDRFAGIDIDTLLNRVDRRPRSYGRKNCLYEAPEFTRRLNGEETVMEGQSLCLDCKVIGFPAPSLRWFKDDEEIIDHPRIRVEGDGKGHYSLYIDHVNKGDEAAYRCRAENVEGSSSCFFFLSVKGKPKSSRKKRDKNSSKKRSVSFPPMFSTIVEKVEEEEKQGREQEHLPPSPLTQFYYAMTLKGRQTWPSFLGDWAFRHVTVDDGDDDDDESSATGAMLNGHGLDDASDRLSGRALMRRNQRRRELNARSAAKRRRMQEEEDEQARKKSEEAQKREEEEKRRREEEAMMAAEEEKERRQREETEIENRKREEARRQRRLRREQKAQEEHDMKIKQMEEERQEQERFRREEEEKEQERRRVLEQRIKEQERIKDEERKKEEERKREELLKEEKRKAEQKRKEEEKKAEERRRRDEEKKREEERQREGKRRKEEEQRRLEEKRRDDEKKQAEKKRKDEEMLKEERTKEVKRKEVEKNRAEEQKRKAAEESRLEEEQRRNDGDHKKKEEGTLKGKRDENLSDDKRMHPLQKSEDASTNNADSSKPTHAKQKNVLHKFAKYLDEKELKGQGQTSSPKAPSLPNKNIASKWKVKIPGTEEKMVEGESRLTNLQKQSQLPDPSRETGHESTVSKKTQNIPLEKNVTCSKTLDDDDSRDEKRKVEVGRHDVRKEENLKETKDEVKGTHIEKNEDLKLREKKPTAQEKMEPEVKSKKDEKSKEQLTKEEQLRKEEELKEKMKARQREQKESKLKQHKEKEQEELRRRQQQQKDELKLKMAEEEKRLKDKKEKEQKEQRMRQYLKEKIRQEQLQRQFEEEKRKKKEREEEVKRRIEQKAQEAEEKRLEIARKAELEKDLFEVKIYKRDYSFADLRKSLEAYGGGEVINAEEHKYWDEILEKHNYSISDLKSAFDMSSKASGHTQERQSRSRVRRNSIEGDASLERMKRSGSLSDLRDAYTKSLDRPKKNRSDKKKKEQREDELMKRSSSISDLKEIFATPSSSSSKLSSASKNPETSKSTTEGKASHASPRLKRVPKDSPSSHPELMKLSVNVAAKRASFHEMVSQVQEKNKQDINLLKERAKKRQSVHGFDSYGSREIPIYKRVSSWRDDDESPKGKDGASGTPLSPPSSRSSSRPMSPNEEGGGRDEQSGTSSRVRPFVYNSIRTIARNDNEQNGKGDDNDDNDDVFEKDNTNISPTFYLGDEPGQSEPMPGHDKIPVPDGNGTQKTQTKPMVIQTGNGSGSLHSDSLNNITNTRIGTRNAIGEPNSSSNRICLHAPHSNDVVREIDAEADNSLVSPGIFLEYAETEEIPCDNSDSTFQREEREPTPFFKPLIGVNTSKCPNTNESKLNANFDREPIPFSDSKNNPRLYPGEGNSSSESSPDKELEALDNARSHFLTVPSKMTFNFEGPVRAPRDSTPTPFLGDGSSTYLVPDCLVGLRPPRESTPFFTKEADKPLDKTDSKTGVTQETPPVISLPEKDVKTNDNNSSKETTTKVSRVESKEMPQHLGHDLCEANGIQNHDKSSKVQLIRDKPASAKIPQIKRQLDQDSKSVQSREKTKLPSYKGEPPSTHQSTPDRDVITNLRQQSIQIDNAHTLQTSDDKKLHPPEKEMSNVSINQSNAKGEMLMHNNDSSKVNSRSASPKTMKRLSTQPSGPSNVSNAPISTVPHKKPVSAEQNAQAKFVEPSIATKKAMAAEARKELYRQRKLREKTDQSADTKQQSETLKTSEHRAMSEATNEPEIDHDKSKTRGNTQLPVPETRQLPHSTIEPSPALSTQQGKVPKSTSTQKKTSNEISSKMDTAKTIAITSTASTTTSPSVRSPEGCHTSRDLAQSTKSFMTPFTSTKTNTIASLTTPVSTTLKQTLSLPVPKRMAVAKPKEVTSPLKNSNHGSRSPSPNKTGDAKSVKATSNLLNNKNASVAPKDSSKAVHSSQLQAKINIPKQTSSTDSSRCGGMSRNSQSKTRPKNVIVNVSPTGVANSRKCLTTPETTCTIGSKPSQPSSQMITSSASPMPASPRSAPQKSNGGEEQASGLKIAKGTDDFSPLTQMASKSHCNSRERMEENIYNTSSWPKYSPESPATFAATPSLLYSSPVYPVPRTTVTDIRNSMPISHRITKSSDSERVSVSKPSKQINDSIKLDQSVPDVSLWSKLLKAFINSFFDLDNNIPQPQEEIPKPSKHRKLSKSGETRVSKGKSKSKATARIKSKNSSQSSPFGRYIMEGLFAVCIMTFFALLADVRVEVFICYVLAAYYTFFILCVLRILE